MPSRTSFYYRKYQEIIADYNREKDRATVEATFAALVDLAASLDAEQRRAAEEGLSDEELALFDLLFRDSILDRLYESLPRPPFTGEDTDTLAERVYQHVWQQSGREPGSSAHHA